MSALVESLNQVSPAWAAMIAAGVWQSTLLAGIVAAIAWLLRRASPAARYWLWQVIAIKLLLLFVWTWSVAVPWPAAQPPGPVPSDSREIAAAPPGELAVPLPEIDRPATNHARIIHVRAANDAPRVWWPRRLSWMSWAMAAWSAVVLLQLGRLVAQLRRLAGLMSRATPGSEEIVEQVRRVGKTIGLSGLPTVWLTDESCTPFVCGVRRAKLVLPRGVLASIDPRELTPILAHELAHLKRYDLVWGWLSESARMLYFFHPVMHWVSYRVRLERELACDQVAMAATGQRPAEYAELLVRVLSAVSGTNQFRVAVAGLDGGSTMTSSPPGIHDGDIAP